MKIRNALLFLLVLISFSGFSSETIHQLLPEKDNCGEWLIAAPAEHYKTEELYYLINGGADLYLEYGFQEVIAQTYENNHGDKISVEIYDMGTDSAAYGIFTMNRIANGKEVNIGQMSLKSDYSLSFWKGNFFVLMRSGKVNTQTAEGFCLLAELIAKKIMPKGELPHLVKDFNKGSSTTYFMGTLGLSSVYYFDYSNVFKLKHGVAAVSGDSIDIQLAYPNVMAADSAFKQGVEFLKNKEKFTFVDENQQAYKFLDRKGKTLHIKQKAEKIHIQIL